MSLGVVDRGLLPDAMIAAQHPVPPPSRVESALDERRVRAAFVTVLRHAADDGDALLSEDDALTRVGKLDLDHRALFLPSGSPGHCRRPRGEVDASRRSDRPRRRNEHEPVCSSSSSKNAKTSCAASSPSAQQGQVPSLKENWSDLIALTVGEDDMPSSALTSGVAKRYRGAGAAPLKR